MTRLIVSAVALAFLASMLPARAGPGGDGETIPYDGKPTETSGRVDDAPPAETEMPTADTDAAEEKAEDRLPEEGKIDQFGDPIDSGFEVG